MGKCLLLSGKSSTGTAKAAFSKIILFHRISKFISLRVMANDETE